MQWAMLWADTWLQASSQLMYVEVQEEEKKHRSVMMQWGGGGGGEFDGKTRLVQNWDPSGSRKSHLLSDTFGGTGVKSVPMPTTIPASKGVFVCFFHYKQFQPAKKAEEKQKTTF